MDFSMEQWIGELQIYEQQIDIATEIILFKISVKMSLS